MINFSKEMVKRRKELGMSRYALAKATGIHAQTLATYEHGAVPALDKAEIICKALNWHPKLGEGRDKGATTYN